MADMTIEDNTADRLRHRAGELASAAESLGALFEVEATRLRRQDEVARLNALCSAVLQRVEWEKRIEAGASSGHSQVEAVVSLFRLAGGLITSASDNRTMQAISRQLLVPPRGPERPYGMVMVRVGSRGVPEDVSVVNVSGLARESNRDERQVMNALRERGDILSSAEAFSALIDRLSTEILKGDLHSPVSSQKVAELRGGHVLRVIPGKKA